MLGPLLRSVGDNIERLGLPDALTGPVRRGDAVTVQKHLSALKGCSPQVRQLYLAAANAQLPMAEALQDASPGEFARVRRTLAAARRRAKS